MQNNNDAFDDAPTKKLTTEKLFGFESDFKLHGFAKPHALTPAIDPTYQFDRATTLAILAGFEHNRRVLVQGYHGTGKSTHIEQVAARLNWPCLRINMDSHISCRMASRSPRFRKGLFRGRCVALWRWCSMNMMPAGPM